jgi:hypothetical protein
VPHKPDSGVVSIDAHVSCKAEVDALAKKVSAWRAAGEREVIALFPDRKVLHFYKAELEKRGIVCDARAVSGDREQLAVLLRLVAIRDQPLLERYLLTYFRRVELRYVSDVMPRLAMHSLRDALDLAAGAASWQKPVQTAYGEYLTTRTNPTSADPKTVAAALARLGHPLDETVVAQVLDDSSTVAVRERIDNALGGEEAAETPSFRLRLLTMHSAKGLSKGIIVMPGLEDKWIPGSSRDADLLEKHRLFYVALTRAEREVHISFPKTRARKDPLNYTPEGTNAGPSRYATRLRLS